MYCHVSAGKLNLIVRVYLGAFVFIIELLFENLHPCLMMLLFLLLFLLCVVFLIQLVLLPLAALSGWFGWRLSDFCGAGTSSNVSSGLLGTYFKVVSLHFSSASRTILPHCHEES